MPALRYWAITAIFAAIDCMFIYGAHVTPNPEAVPTYHALSLITSLGIGVAIGGRLARHECG